MNWIVRYVDPFGSTTFRETQCLGVSVCDDMLISEVRLNRPKHSFSRKDCSTLWYWLRTRAVA